MTSGARKQRRDRLLAFAVLLAAGALQAYANGISRYEDLRGAGSAVAGWEVALDETTSLLAWYLLIPVVWQLVARVRPPRHALLAALALHALATIPVSLAHVGIFVVLREAGYGALGFSYDFTDDWRGSLLYEYRKDVMTYLVLGLALAVIQWLTGAPGGNGETSAGGKISAGVVTVVDGSVTHKVPSCEIEWAEAAGNYVTLHWRGQALLHRTTLTALESELAAHGFARIHRSRLVRRDAVRRVETGQSGDFTVTLESGEILRGSRRFREGLRGG